MAEPLRLRRGRHNPWTLYRDTGDTMSSAEDAQVNYLGAACSPEAAQAIVDAVNATADERASRQAWADEALRLDAEIDGIVDTLRPIAGNAENDPKTRNAYKIVVGWLSQIRNPEESSLANQEQVWSELWAKTIRMAEPSSNVMADSVESWAKGRRAAELEAQAQAKQATESWTLAELPASAAEIVDKLRANGFPAETGPTRQVLCLAEEAGEFVGAYRRWAGLARRRGDFQKVRDELADVVIAAAVAAQELDIDLTSAVAEKLGVVRTRGWREEDEDG